MLIGLLTNYLVVFLFCFLLKVRIISYGYCLYFQTGSYLHYLNKTVRKTAKQEEDRGAEHTD